MFLQKLKKSHKPFSYIYFNLLIDILFADFSKSDILILFANFFIILNF